MLCGLNLCGVHGLSIWIPQKLNKLIKIPWTVHGLNLKSQCPYCQKNHCGLAMESVDNPWNPQIHMDSTRITWGSDKSSKEDSKSTDIFTGCQQCWGPSSATSKAPYSDSPNQWINHQPWERDIKSGPRHLGQSTSSHTAWTCGWWWRAWYLLWGEKGKCEQIWNKPKPTNTNTKSNTN